MSRNVRASPSCGSELLSIYQWLAEIYPQIADLARGLQT
jgi:hypothetical protein